MDVRYINCATMYPRLAGLFAPVLDRSPAICMLLEDGDRLILVDTGYGTADMADTTRLGPGDILLNTRPDPGQPAVKQIERMRLDPGSVTDVICTHLDRDHAGGLADFPRAKVHVLAAEREAALGRATAADRERYRECHFAHGPKWVTHGLASKERWFGMECIRDIPGLPPEVLLVPLQGHTRGHAGIAVETEHGWVLHCGDAYYVKEELRQKGDVSPGVRFFRGVAHSDRAEARYRVEQLKRLVSEHGDQVSLLASHDQYEYRNLFGRPLD